MEDVHICKWSGYVHILAVVLPAEVNGSKQDTTISGLWGAGINVLRVCTQSGSGAIYWSSQQFFYRAQWGRAGIYSL